MYQVALSHHVTSVRRTRIGKMTKDGCLGNLTNFKLIRLSKIVLGSSCMSRGSWCVRWTPSCGGTRNGQHLLQWVLGAASTSRMQDQTQTLFQRCSYSPTFGIIRLLVGIPSFPYTPVPCQRSKHTPISAGALRGRLNLLCQVLIMCYCLGPACFCPDLSPASARWQG